MIFNIRQVGHGQEVDFDNSQLRLRVGTGHIVLCCGWKGSEVRIAMRITKP
jgi:hypothetical protein